MIVTTRNVSNAQATVNVTCNGCPLECVRSYKYLGLVIDDRLSWDAHVDYLTRKIAPKIGALYRATRQLDRKSRRLFYLAVIQQIGRAHV